MTERVAKAHYLRLYKAADDILKQPDNPCQIHMENGKPTCAVSRDDTFRGFGFASPHLCCGGCKHLGPNGCTTQALYCKLGWCYSNQNSIRNMKFSDHPTFAKIEELRDEALKLIPALFRDSWRKNPLEKAGS
jgi:hypothetical protein